MDPNSLLEKSDQVRNKTTQLFQIKLDPPKDEQKLDHFETIGYKILRFFNIFALLSFMLMFCLTYIFIGFNHHFLLFQIEAAVFSAQNFLYVNLSHDQKLKWVNYLKLSVYLPSIFSIGICGLFSFLAIEDTEDSSDSNNQYMGKWMLTFITLYLTVITSFILNAREFKILYIDNAPEEDSEDEFEEDDTQSQFSSYGSQDSEEIDEEDGAEQIHKNYGINNDNRKRSKKEKMEIIYIS